MVEAGSNLRLENKLMTMDYDTAMRSWMADPEDSESDDDEDEKDGAVSPIGASGEAYYWLAYLRNTRRMANLNLAKCAFSKFSYFPNSHFAFLPGA